MTGIYSARDIEKLVNGAGLSGGGGTIDESKFVKSENGFAKDLTTKGILHVQGENPSWVVEKVAEFNGCVDFNDGVNFQFPDKIQWNFDDGKATTRAIQTKNLLSISQDIEDVKASVEKIKAPDIPANIADKKYVDDKDTEFKTALEAKITEETGKLVPKTDYDTKIAEIETSITNNKTALEAKITEETSKRVLQTEYDTKVEEIEKKITDEVDGLQSNHLQFVQGYDKTIDDIKKFLPKLKNYGSETTPVERYFYNWDKNIEFENEVYFKVKGFSTSDTITVSSIFKKMMFIQPTGETFPSMKFGFYQDKTIQIGKAPTNASLDYVYSNDVGHLVKDLTGVKIDKVKLGDETSAADRLVFDVQPYFKQDFWISYIPKDAINNEKRSTAFSKQICWKFDDFKDVERKKHPIQNGKTVIDILHFPVRTYFIENVWIDDGTNNINQAFNLRDCLKQVSDQKKLMDSNVLDILSKFHTEDFALQRYDEQQEKWEQKNLHTLAVKDKLYFEDGWVIRYCVSGEGTIDAKYNYLTSDSFCILHKLLDHKFNRHYYTNKINTSRNIGKTSQNKKQPSQFRAEIPQTLSNTEDENSKVNHEDIDFNAIDWNEFESEIDAEHQLIDRLFEYIDITYNGLNETDEDLENNHLTNKQLGLIFRNTIFAESMKNKIPIKPMKPQELAAYGFVNFEQHGSEIFEDFGRHANKKVTYSIDSNENSVLNIELTGIDHYKAEHLIIHVFDRQRSITKNSYALSNIDLIFDIKLNTSEITSNISSKLFTYTLTKSEDKVDIQIVGTFNLKMLPDQDDANTWEGQEDNIEPDIKLENRIIVYYQLPINENFKNYLASLGSSSGGTVDTDTSTKISNLENQLKKLQNSMILTNNAIKTETDKGYQSEDAANTFSLETHGVEGQEVVDQENLTFDQVLTNWVDTNKKQIEYLNGGLSVCWEGINAIDDDIEYLMKKTCNCVNETNLHQLDDRLKILEKKCENIEGDSPTVTTGEITLENLMKAYDERIRILEKKCQNIV